MMHVRIRGARLAAAALLLCVVVALPCSAQDGGADGDDASARGDDPSARGDDASARGDNASARGDASVRGDDPFANVRAEFLAALNAVAAEAEAEAEAGPEAATATAATEADASAASDSPELRAYPLYPYLEAARIEHALARASAPSDPADKKATAFVARHAGEPIAREIERAWLSSLARREDWGTFLEQYRAGAADDVLRCQAFSARIALGLVEGIAPEIVAVWLTGRRLPQECEPVFEWLRKEGPLTDEIVERRVVLLLENGEASFARLIARRLPDAKAAPLLAWASLIEKPRASIDALLAAPDKSVDRTALLDGWSRLARDDPDAALERYEPLVEALDLDASDASQLAVSLALGLAWDRRPEALDYFARAKAQDVDDYALAWRTRAALWTDDWRLAAESIDAMSATQRGESRWIYFRARAAEKLRDRAHARDLYRSLLTRDNYFSGLAAARLGEPAAPHVERVRAEDREIERIAARPAFVRARELYYSGLPWNASAEWRYGSAKLDETARVASIRVAARWGWYDLAISTATSQRVFNDYDLLYPRPYGAAVGAAADLTKLEPPLIYALIRQESLYRRDASSRAGAVGLVQLMPDTARRVAAEWGLPRPQRADLLLPEVNVKLGAAKLRSLVEDFGGQLPAGLAAYNAGANAVRRWLPDRVMDADVWIENIPYNETRDFVQRVLWHSLVFAWLDEREPRSTKPWLATISPASDAPADDGTSSAR
ncbi:MAG TPA: transglycosylase SLT domain-containing protein [Gammaproteobacteria bacterium]|nr:transglycosylase SLT domain-containing protein [Gammaproteobacteria bacterium]